MEYITTQIASQRLGVSVRRVRALIAAGRLPATRLGHNWAIHSSDLDLVKIRRPGRPCTEARHVDKS